METYEEVLLLAKELKRTLIKLDLILISYYDVNYPDYNQDFYVDAILCNIDAMDNTKKLLHILENK